MGSRQHLGRQQGLNPVGGLSWGYAIGSRRTPHPQVPRDLHRSLEFGDQSRSLKNWGWWRLHPQLLRDLSISLNSGQSALVGDLTPVSGDLLNLWWGAPVGELPPGPPNLNID
ncbi:hypothetical protein CRG98_024763 [Punica granatum]|uniref:Uncharacterized protein n=1 Tax=Punica granatum TaxID=22663 RepID=A0A2I0JG56_PUNGR|nr:hypothetical protein CRG98_024763 [Punica granatum]